MTAAGPIPEPPEDPVSREAGRAIDHLNADHTDALLDMARALGGCPQAESARCLGADRRGLDLIAETPKGLASVRVVYDEPIETTAELRKATVTLARRARQLLA